MLMASSSCLLCSTSYITNYVVIADVTFFDGAAASAQEAEVILQRVRKSTKPGVQTSSSTSASQKAQFLERVRLWITKLLFHSKWSVKLGIPSFSGS
jgi:hypothetical protein